MTDILESAATALLYGVVGFAVMAAGFVGLDLVTPRRLTDVVGTERNRGAAIVLSGQMIGVGIVVAEAIRASESEDGLGYGLLSALVYGMAGVLVMTLVCVVVSLITPGKMGAAMLEDHEGRPHPAAWVQGSMYLGTAIMVAAALS